MLEIKESLLHSDKRIVAISRWRNRLSVHHLRSIYYNTWVGYEKGYRSFFNGLASKMTVSQAADCLDWELSSSNYLTLRIYPCSGFYFSITNSRDEREAVFRAAIRRTMSRLIKQVDLPIKWVAAVNASSCFMVGMVVVSKIVFDKKARRFIAIKKCFPRSFFERNEPTAENVNYIESTIAESFFECAALTEDFESRIDDLIKVSRRYKFDLPVSYYAFRYFDNNGNLMTEWERRLGKYE